MYYDFKKPKYFLVMKFFPGKDYFSYAGLGDFKEIVTVDYLLCNRNRDSQSNSSRTLNESMVLDEILKIERVPNEFVMKVKAVTSEISEKDEEGILEFCGYDILENEHCEISHLLNCGGEFKLPNDKILTKYSLINSYENVLRFIELNKEHFYNKQIDYEINLNEDVIAIWKQE